MRNFLYFTDEAIVSTGETAHKNGIVTRWGKRLTHGMQTEIRPTVGLSYPRLLPTKKIQRIWIFCVELNLESGVV